MSGVGEGAFKQPTNRGSTVRVGKVTTERRSIALENVEPNRDHASDVLREVVDAGEVPEGHWEMLFPGRARGQETTETGGPRVQEGNMRWKTRREEI
jgi:hypothetical protein